jgi:hypothetical protein
MVYERDCRRRRKVTDRFATLCLMLAVVSMPAAATAQSTLFTPRAVKRAYQMGTRQADGRPGPKYWQNRARYTMDIGVAPPSRIVKGSEQITYYNESRDTLRQLVIKLFMNSHRPGAPRTLGVTTDYLTSGVHVDSFVVRGTSMRWSDDGAFTSVPIALTTPLPPHDSIHLAFAWRYELARQPAREGAIDSTTFYLAYFYPRIAVYDDYNGWDTMDFADIQEFYNDFNDYDVTIHAPANYIVWGTGTLTNAAEILEPMYLQRFERAFESDSTIHIATRAELARGGVTLTRGNNAWHFTSRGIPDVAFGISDHYDWDAASVAVGSGRERVSVQAAYNDTAADFHHMVQMARASVAFFSSTLPGVPYPYEKTTVFQGGAGMEYPMMVNDESYPDTALASAVAGHEIAHSYMPFYMGIDETRYPFMDEGWAVTFEYPNNQRIMGKASALALYKSFRVVPWESDSTILVDVPIVTPADAIRGIGTYRSDAYGKPSLGYLAVEDLLGEPTFKRALHAYMERWHGKHPSPWDFFNSFNAASGRDLDWFWSNWFFSYGYIDVGIATVKRTRDGYQIGLSNVGGYAAPVDLVLDFADGTTQTIHETIAIWERDQRSATIMLPTAKVLRALRLSGGIWMDENPSNDAWSAR